MRIKVLSTNIPKDDSLLSFVGKTANICYMKGSIDEVMQQNKESAVKRALSCGQNGHHSVFDHAQVTLQIEGLSKVFILILNSIGMYAASERSGRYCEFKGESELDMALYNKWRDKIFELTKTIPCFDGITERQRVTIANENARYMISIFAKNGELVYTTNIRMLAYLYQWLDKLSKKIEEKNSNYFFDIKLNKEIKEFREFLLEEVFKKLDFNVDILKDNKNAEIEVLLEYCDKFNSFDITKAKNNVSKYTYEYIDSMSFVALDHKIRSRKLNIGYSISSDIESYFCPDFIDIESDLWEEWLNDCHSLYTQGIIPQCFEVDTFETGSKIDFFRYQVAERMCSRVLLETYQHVSDQAVSLFLKDDCDFVREFFDKVEENADYVEYKLKSKCQMGKCVEPCKMYKKDLADRIF